MTSDKKPISINYDTIGRKFWPSQTFKCGLCAEGPELKINTGSGAAWYQVVMFCPSCKSTFTFDDDQTMVGGIPRPKFTRLVQVWGKDGPVEVEK